MIGRALILVSFCLFPMAAFGEGVTTGSVFGTNDAKGSSWMGWTALDVAPLQGGIVEHRLPPGSLVVDWEALATRTLWAGWTHTEKDWSTRVASGFALPGEVSALWESTPFRLDLAAPWGVWVEQRWRDIQFGGGRAESKGSFLAEDGFDLGPFSAQAWVLRGGFSFLAAFYGEVRADLKLERSNIFWWLRGSGGSELRWFGLQSQGPLVMGPPDWAWNASALYADGRVHGQVGRGLFPQGIWETKEESQIRTVVAWLDQTWTENRWSAGLTAIGALVWVEHPTWTQLHSWTEITWTFPFFFAKTSRSQYTFEASPGWVTVIRPKVKWYPWRGVSMEWSRWIPLAGGFRQAFGIDPDAVATSTSGASGEAPSLSPWDLWLAGTQIQLSVAW